MFREREFCNSLGRRPVKSKELSLSRNMVFDNSLCLLVGKTIGKFIHNLWWPLDSCYTFFQRESLFGLVLGFSLWKESVKRNVQWQRPKDYNFPCFPTKKKTLSERMRFTIQERTLPLPLLGWRPQYSLVFYFPLALGRSVRPLDHFFATSGSLVAKGQEREIKYRLLCERQRVGASFWWWIVTNPVRPRTYSQRRPTAGRA